MASSWFFFSTQKYTLCCHCGTDIFQERFLEKVMGTKGGVDFTVGFMHVQTCEKGLYVCVCVFCLVLPQ